MSYVTNVYYIVGKTDVADNAALNKRPMGNISTFIVPVN